jgi:hypothetical protein
VLQTLHAPAAHNALSEAHRHAYNAAFHELDMNWQWDCATFARLQPYGRAGLRSYLQTEQPHLLRAYAADFLVDVIESAKARYLAAMAAATAPARTRLAA